MPTLLHLNNPAVKQIMRDNGLRKEDIIGRGFFSIVFKGTREDSVLKLTVCDLSYAMLCDDLSVAREHEALPKVYQDFGCVGMFYFAGRNYSSVGQNLCVYLYEIERLERCDNKAKRLGRHLTTVGSRNYYKSGDCTATCFLGASKELSNNRNMPSSWSEKYADLFDRIGRFLLDWGVSDKVCYDLHAGNMMMRPDGELVITDPILETRLYNLAVGRKYE